MTTVLLVDNGSVKPAATLQLRHIAQQLSQQSEQHIHPVSLQHAGVISAEALGGIKATVFTDFLQQKLTAGEQHFVVLPLFFGKSRALTAFIPQQQALLAQTFGEFEITIADVLYPLPDGDERLATIVYEHIQQTADHAGLPLKNIALVDHGSPLPQVTQVRNGVTDQVQAKLADSVQVVDQVAMERRKGRQYDFNGTLLVDWLMNKAEQGERSAIVGLLFALPGRHAGAEGDIVTICESVMQRYPDFTVAISPLVGEHPLLIDMLYERLLTTQTQQP